MYRTYVCDLLVCSAARAATRIALDCGDRVLGCSDGFEGLARGMVKPLQWMDVDDWANMGGCALGTNRVLPRKHLAEIAAVLETHKVLLHVFIFVCVYVCVCPCYLAHMCCTCVVRDVGNGFLMSRSLASLILVVLRH